MADIINKFYRKIANNGNDSDYELVGEIGVGGKSLEDYLMHSDVYTTLFDHIYPVGSIYFSVKNENPSSKFGGTWVSWGAGKFIVGVNGSDSSFNSVEKTGGSKTHNHTITVNNKASFTSGRTSLTAAQLPNVRGNITVHNYAVTSDIQAVTGCFSNTYTSPNYTNEQSLATRGISGVGRITFDNGGKGQSHTHSIPTHNHTASSNSPTALPPYITCYMWKRTK